MHDYDLPKFDRIRIYYFIGLVASVVFGQLLLVPTWFEETAPSLASILRAIVPSISGLIVFGLVHWAFSRHIWKWGWTQKLVLKEVPTFDGIWKGTVQPFLRDGQPLDQRPAPTEVTVIVEQTFEKISLTLRASTGRAGSVSTMARLKRENAHQVDIEFGYRGWSVKDAGRIEYDGETKLTFSQELAGGASVPHPAANGRYYTDAQRSTRGEIKLVYSGPRQA